MCDYLGVSRGGFYDWRDRPKSERAQYDEMLVEQIKEMHVGHNRNYGAFRVHKYLREIDWECSRRRINRLMKAHGIRSIYHAYKARRRSGGQSVVADNILATQPIATQVGEHWAGDMTYLKTKQGPLYMAIVMDLFTRRVVGWGFSQLHDADLVTGALKMSAKYAHKQPGCLFHSDQGSEYRSDTYQETIEKNGLISSMSRAGTPTDNAYVESFFGTLKNELIYHWKFKTFVECVARVIDYVEFYNEDRLHSSLDYMSPKTYEMKNA